MDDQKPERLNTSKEIAKRLQLSIAWLNREAWLGTGPPFIKIGNNRRYPENEFQAWLERQPRGGSEIKQEKD